MKWFLISLFCMTGLLTGSAPKKFSYKAESLDATAARKTKMQKALKLFTDVMNNKSFTDSLKKKKFYSDRSDDPNRGLTTSQIVAKLYIGKERYTSLADSIANIYWKIVIKSRPNTSRPAIGYGYAGGKTIYTYSWAFDSYSIEQIAGHIAHEWAHKVGFVHTKKYHRNRDRTVPYAFGYLVKYYGRKINGISTMDGGGDDDMEHECAEMNELKTKK